MSEQKLSRTVRVISPQGLHARPADLLVKAAKRFACKIEIVKGHERVDCKSILEIFTLAAVEGTVLVIEAEGPDAEAALVALAELFDNSFFEGQEHN